MAEYIKREDAIRAIRQYQYPYGVEFLIRNLPAADVAEVKHGEWVDFIGNPVAWDKEHKDCPEGNAVCSKCGRWLVASDEYLTIGRYCPNCGALMKEDEHEAG